MCCIIVVTIINKQLMGCSCFLCLVVGAGVFTRRCPRECDFGEMSVGCVWGIFLGVGNFLWENVCGIVSVRDRIPCRITSVYVQRL